MKINSINSFNTTNVSNTTSFGKIHRKNKDKNNEVDSFTSTTKTKEKDNDNDFFSKLFGFFSRHRKEAAIVGATATILTPLASCSKDTNTDAQSATPDSAYVEFVPYDDYNFNFEDAIKNIRYEAKDNYVTLQNKQTPNNVREGETLREILTEQYKDLAKANDEELGHAAVQLIEGNPLVYGLIEKNSQQIFGRELDLVPAQDLLDVEFIDEFNETAESAYETYGMLMSMVDIVGELAPQTDETYISYDNTYKAQNSSVIIDSTLNTSSAKTAKNLTEAIELNYGVSKDSPDFYALLYGVVTEPKNSKIFKGDNIAVKQLIEEWNKKLGSVDDFNVMEFAMKLEDEGVLEGETIYFPEREQRVSYTVEEGVTINPEDITLKNADFSALRPTKTTLSVMDKETGKQNVSSIYDLIEQYTTVDGDYVLDKTDNKIYVTDIKNAIIGNYPEAFDEDGMLIKDEKGEPVVSEFNLYPVYYNLLDQGETTPVEKTIKQIEEKTGKKIDENKSTTVIKKKDGSSTVIQSEPEKDEKGVVINTKITKIDIDIDLNIENKVIINIPNRPSQPEEPTTKERITKERTTKERTTKEHTTKEHTTKERTTREHTTKEPTTRTPIVTLPDDTTHTTKPTTKPSTTCEEPPEVDPDERTTKPRTTREYTTHATTTKRQTDVDDIRTTRPSTTRQTTTRPTTTRPTTTERQTTKATTRPSTTKPTTTRTTTTRPTTTQRQIVTLPNDEEEYTTRPTTTRPTTTRQTTTAAPVCDDLPDVDSDW